MFPEPAKTSQQNLWPHFAWWTAAFLLCILVASLPLLDDLDRVNSVSQGLIEQGSGASRAAVSVETGDNAEDPEPAAPISPQILQNCLQLIPLEEYRKRNSSTSYWGRQNLIHSTLENQFDLPEGSLMPALYDYSTQILNTSAEGTAEDRLNCARASYYLENFSKAEETAMAVFAEATTDPQKSEALEMAAWSARSQGDSYRAERLLREALALRRPAENFERWVMLQHLTAELQMDQQNYSRAEKGFSRLVREYLGRKNYNAPSLHLAWQMLIKAQMEQGKTGAAIKHLQVQNKILEKQLGAGHALAMANRKTLIQAMTQEQRFPEALALADQLLERQMAVMPEMERVILLSRIERAALLTRTDQAGAAAEELHALLPELERIFGEDSPQMLSARANLAAALAATKSLARAETLYRELIPLSESIAGPEDPLTLSLLLDFARMLGRQERSREAGQLAMRVERLRQKHLGKNHPDTREAREFLQSLARQSSP